MERRGEISLFELQSRIAFALEEALPESFWVCAEIVEIKVNYSGHCYLELIEKQEGTSTGSVAKAQARGVIWRSTYTRLAPMFERVSGRSLAAGMKILVKATVSYHPVYGLSLQISDIDPAYTLGDMERMRQQTIEQLKREGVWDMNRALPMPIVVQRIAVVSSASAAGYRDFCRELEARVYRIESTLFEAVMQGNTSEQSIIEALQRVAERVEEFDAVAIIRGGGSTGDLESFNGYMLSLYVAQFPLPVLTGIGHDKDVSIADMVAAQPLKTPTAVAAWLADRAEAFDADLEYAAVRLREAYSRISHSAEMALQNLAAEIQSRTQRVVSDSESRLLNFHNMLKMRCEGILQRESGRVESYDMIAANFAPERVLQMGFALARVGGRAIRGIEQVECGEPIEIILSDGVITAEILDKKREKDGKE